MSVEEIQKFLQISKVPLEDMAKRMLISPDELEDILSGQIRTKRSHQGCYDHATLSLALERRDTSFVRPSFHWKMLRYAMLVLQEQRPVEADATQKPEAQVSEQSGKPNKHAAE